MSDFEKIQEALYGAANVRRVPDLGGFCFNAILTNLFLPALAWLIFASAELLPMTISGYFSVVAVVLLLRLSIIGNGLAKLEYNLVPIEPPVVDDDDDDDDDDDKE